ncbi:MAG: LacI family DNA-binding transcriptional regulator [Velocimicrobium sp.]
MKKKPLYQEIYEQLLEKIEKKVYLPGDKLPSAKDLAEQYGVSLITSKRALDILAKRNHVIRKTGLGSFVQELNNLEQTQSRAMKEMMGKENKNRKSVCVIFDSFDYIFGSRMLSSIERACNQNNQDMIFRCTYGNLDLEKQAIQDALDAGVSGIIIMCVQDELFNENILRCALDGFPVVLLDRTMTGISIPCVTTDNYAAAKQLTNCLFNQGATQICFVSHQYHETPTIKDRLRGFVESNLEHQIIVNESNKILDMQCSAAYRGMDKFHAQRNEIEMDKERIRQYIKENETVDAFFAVQYDLGLTIYQVLLELQLETKITVAVFDGPEKDMTPFQLFNRVIQDENKIGEMAVQILIDRISGKLGVEKNFIPYTIIEKE